MQEVIFRLCATIAKLIVNLRQTAREVTQQATRTDVRILPDGKVLVTSVIKIVVPIIMVYMTVPFAQKPSSGNGFTELKVDSTRHLNCLPLDDFCQAREVAKRNR